MLLCGWHALYTARCINGRLIDVYPEACRPPPPLYAPSNVRAPHRSRFFSASPHFSVLPISPLRFACVCLLADEALFYEHVQKYDLRFATGDEFASRLEIFANKV